MATNEYKSRTGSLTIPASTWIKCTRDKNQLLGLELRHDELARAGFKADQPIHMCVLRGSIVLMADPTLLSAINENTHCAVA